MSYKQITQCRSCGWTELEPVLSLPGSGPGNFPTVINFGDKEGLHAPLNLVLCPKCTLLQLMHTVDPEYLFRSYYYKSGVNEQMKDSLKDIVKQIERRPELANGDRVVDIGANDGTLLSAYTYEVEKVAFEPAANLHDELAKKADAVIGEFFSAEKLMGLKAKVITCVAMFYDLDDPNTFLEDVKKVLADDGLFVIQQNYLPAMLKNNAFDNIVHEHLEYYSVTSLHHLLWRHNLLIDDIEFNDVNGGSFRVYVKHKPNDVNVIGAHQTILSPLSEILQREKEMALDKPQTYREFDAKVDIIQWKIRRLFEQLKKERKIVYLAGASTRGNTLLQVCKLGRKEIYYAVERNPAKHGTVFNGIPVVSEEFAEEMPPDYYLILPWHFLGSFVVRHQEYLRRGGKIIVPLPKPVVLEMKEL